MKKLAFLFVALIAFAAPARAQYLAPSFFGMNFSSTPASNPITTPYTAAKLLGGTWSGVENCRPANPANQADGCWYWTSLDAGLAMCGAIGVDCDYVLLMNTPTWATAAHDTAAPPDDLNDLYNFATTFATRYKGKVKLYEVANEMSYSGWYDGTLAQIVTISNQLCSIIHATDPAAKLYSPSTFYISGEQYFANYLAAGGSTCDGVALHPYPLFTNTDYNPTVGPEESWNQVQFYSALFKQYGQSNLLISEGGQTWSTYDPAADGAIWLLQMTGFAYNGFATRVMPYSWNIQTRVGLGYTDARGAPNTRGVAYMNAQAWLEGATVTQPPTRTAGANGIRNPNGTGFTAGTPGTPPTNWALAAPDSGFGVSTQIVGACANNGVSGVAWRVWGTPTTGAAGYTKLTLEGTQQIAASLGQWWTRGGTASLIAGSLTGISTVTNGWNEMSSGGGSLGNTGSNLNSRITPIAPAVAQAYSVMTKQAGVAFVQPGFTLNYSVGSTFDATFCLTGQTMDTGNVWTMTIARPGGYQGLIVWSANYSGPVSYSVPGQYLFWRDVMGNNGAVKNGAITIGARPILVENQQSAGWTP